MLDGPGDCPKPRAKSQVGSWNRRGGCYSVRVSDAFLISDPHDAQDFLSGFSPASQREGDALFSRGAVRDLAAKRPGVAYSAVVGSAENLQQVELVYEPGTGWGGGCTCDQDGDCAHVFAAMRSLLAEHRATAVRSLSGGTAGRAAAVSAARLRPDPAVTSELARRLVAALGRGLKPEEMRYLRQVHEVYGRCINRAGIAAEDFAALGMPLPGSFHFGSLRIWPSLPTNEHEFWLHVACEAHRHEVPVPELMGPVTDFQQVEQRWAEWQRAREIEQWKNSFKRVRPLLDAEGPQPVQHLDLRVVIDAEAAGLEIQRNPEGAFEPLKGSQFRRLRTEYDEGVVQFTPEGEMIWQCFESLFDLDRVFIQWQYADAETLRRLAQLLRHPLLESRFVNGAGCPLRRPAEPLRWQLTAPAEPDGNYVIRLVQADGAPLPPLIRALEGHPTLYLTADAVFSGPDAPAYLLRVGEANSIPAAAIENADGIVFLRKLGVELPPRLRERIRLVPYEITINCSLVPPSQGVRGETCRVTAVARAADGSQLRWFGYNWVEVTRRNRRPSAEGERDGVITLHDSATLRQFARLLEPLKSRGASMGDGLLCRVGRDFPERFSAWLKSLPPDVTVKLEGELASLANAAVSGKVRFDVQESGIDWFDLRVVLDVSDTTLTPEEIHLLLKARGNYVRLAGKGWRRLAYDVTPEEDERMARLGLSARALSAEPQRLHALQLADPAAASFLPEPQVRQLQRRAGEIRMRVTPELPTGLTATLRPYQLEGFHFLAYLAANRFGGILADDMGLGKTLQTLAWLLWLRAEAGETAAPALVVCPKSVMDNWQAEAARFTPGLRVRAWRPFELDRLPAETASADLHVINYSQLRLLGPGLKCPHWLAVILDEGQYIKNPSSQTAQVARALRADHRLVLSGTPIENRLLDLWSLMAFAMPGVLGSRTHFGRLYDAKGDPFARQRLAARVRPFLLRRTKAQVASDLPERVEEDLFCEVEGEQEALYRAELKRARQLLLGISTQQELARQHFHFLTSLLRLRQICCHPRLVKPDAAAASAKTEALLDLLEPLMEEGQKVLVFSQFVELLHLLKPELEERQWPFFYLAGETENRGELVQAFQDAPGPAVFLISLKAGGFGLNLTAASYVVLFDPWWNPAVENQAIDRTHRLGQANKVIAYRLLAKHSVEEKIRTLQKHKRILAEDVLGEAKFTQSLTLEDLQFLFSE